MTRVFRKKLVLEVMVEDDTDEAPGLMLDAAHAACADLQSNLAFGLDDVPSGVTVIVDVDAKEAEEI